MSKRLEEVVGEIWKPVVGYEGLYEVSNMGRIRSLVSKYGPRPFPRISKLGVSGSGYYYIILTKNRKYKGYRVHRLVAMAFIENTQNKPFVNHINGTKEDNRVENLEWCTGMENVQHAIKNGLNARGESCGAAKLTNDDVVQIKEELKKGNNAISRMSKKHGVSYQTIWAIAKNRSWTYV